MVVFLIWLCGVVNFDCFYVVLFLISCMVVCYLTACKVVFVVVVVCLFLFLFFLVFVSWISGIILPYPRCCFLLSCLSEWLVAL